MAKKIVTKCRTIRATCEQDYDEQFNSIMEEVACYEHSFVQDPSNMLRCFIYYKVVEQTSLRDEYNKDGRRLQCGNGCPYFFLNEDRRLKARCLLHRCIVDPTAQCCEEYLKELKAAEGKRGDVE